MTLHVQWNPALWLPSMLAGHFIFTLTNAQLLNDIKPLKFGSQINTPDSTVDDFILEPVNLRKGEVKSRNNNSISELLIHAKNCCDETTRQLGCSELKLRAHLTWHLN